MKRSKFSEKQVVGVLKQPELGEPVRELIRKYGVSEATFYAWRKVRRAEHHGDEAAEAVGRRESAAEGHGCRLVVGQADPAGGALKKGLKPARKRELAVEVQQKDRLAPFFFAGDSERYGASRAP